MEKPSEGIDLPGENSDFSKPSKQSSRLSMYNLKRGFSAKALSIQEQMGMAVALRTNSNLNLN